MQRYQSLEKTGKKLGLVFDCETWPLQNVSDWGREINFMCW